jgi:DNA-directed RNA polymerase specialized sigma54-like protein
MTQRKRKPGEPVVVRLHPDTYVETDIKIFEVKPGLFAAVKTVAGYGASSPEAVRNLLNRMTR